MKPFKIIFQMKVHIILSSVVICLCTRDIPNPLLDSFKGDYRFDVGWDSLTNKDTLEIFKYYYVPFMVIGIDSFAAFRITDSNNVPITNMNNYSPLHSDSILVCYFTKPYTGNIHIRGVRPNNKEVVRKSPLPLTIINPFRVTVDTLQDMRNRHIAKVEKWFNRSIVPESLSTIWNIGDTSDTVFGLTKNYLATKRKFTVSAEIVDVFNNSLSLDSIFVTTPGFYPVIDSVVITKNPYLGEQCSFTLFTSDMDSTRFQLFSDFNEKPLFNTYPFYQSNKKMDVVTENPFTDTGKGMLTVFLIDSSGLKSNVFRDSIFIAYTLRTPVFESNWLTTSINEPYTIRLVDTNFTDATLYRWQIKRLGIDSTTYSDSFTVIWTDTIQDTVIVSGMDSIGYLGPPDTLIVKPEFPSYTLYKELFPQNILVSVFSTFQINVKDEYGVVVNDEASFEWLIENESMLDSVYRNRDTLRIRAGRKTNSFSMSVRAIVNESDTTDVIIDTVIVVDTLIVKPEFHGYTLHKELFPKNIQALVLTTFQINVKDENGVVVNDNARFEWFIEKESKLDSVYRNRDTLRIRTGRKTNSFSMSVRAIVNESDTTGTIIDTVVVTKIPECVFTQRSYKVLVGDTVSLNVNPGNMDVIDSIYMGFDSKIVGLVKETSHKSVFFSSDTIIAYTWAVTGWGVKTGIDSTVIIVYSNPPALYSNTASFDTAVFINDTVIVSVQGYPGNTISTVTHYFWDLDGDYLWDDTTEVNYYTLTKSTGFDDTLHVGCINDLGDTAVEFFRFHLVVYVGTPVIEEVSCDTTWAFINDRINLFIHATDSNGTISSLFVDTNSDGQGDIIIRDITQTTYIDTVPLFFSGPGIYKLSVWVHDDDTNVSPVYHLSKPVTVDQGVPQITGVKPDTVFIMNENTYTISALDNKIITEYEWSFNNMDFNFLGNVNSFAYSFPDSGWYRLYVRVRDDENNQSPVFLDSVYVIWATPHIDSVLPRTVWVVDTNLIWVSASDNKGSIEKIWVDGNMDDVWDDSSTVTDTFTHWWDTTIGGKFALFNVKVMDNYSFTTEKVCSVFVRKGEPHVWAESDTLYIPSNTGDVTFYVNSFDTNGTIAYYQFDRLADGRNLHTVQDSSLDYDLIFTNNAYLWSVYIKDDDSLFASDTFYVYPDSAPPKPMLVEPISVDINDSSTSTIEFKWRKTDTHDGLATQYRIMVKNGDDFQPLDSMDFKTATDDDLNVDLNDTTFSYQSSNIKEGTNDWFIIARDQLESVTESDTVFFRYLP